jgi:hypothetical protein
MKWFPKAAVGGLLWLSFSAFAFGNSLTITGQSQNVDDGGQFTAYLSSNPSQQLYVYCVDFQNFTTFNNAYPVNISVPYIDNSATVADTRYGTTPTADFAYDGTGPGALDAVQRYVLAAWLVTQYDFSSGVTTADDEIQNAIWTLLNTNSSAVFPGGAVADTRTGTYLTQAITWLNGETPTALAQFESGIQVFTSTDIANATLPCRWTMGYQEMITVTMTPEPATLAMLGLGLLAVGLFRKKVKA